MGNQFKYLLSLMLVFFISGCGGFSLRGIGTQKSTISAQVSTKLIYSEKNTTTANLAQNLLPLTDISSAAVAPPALLPPSLVSAYSPIPITYQNWTVNTGVAITDDLKPVVDATSNRMVTASLTSLWNDSVAQADRGCGILTGYSSSICGGILSINLETRFLLTGVFTVGAYIAGVLSGSSEGISSEHYEYRTMTDLVPGSTDNITGVTEYNGLLYFSSVVASGGSKLFRTDGATVEQLTNNFPSGDDVRNFRLFNGRLYFTAYDSMGFYMLYSTDGSTLQKHTNMTSYDVYYPMVIPGYLLFTARDSGTNLRLYSLSEDGVVRQLSEIDVAGSDWFNYDWRKPAEVGGYTYMGGYTAISGNTTLYRTNGITLQRVISLGMDGGPDGDDRVDIIPQKVGNLILFVAYGFSGGGYVNLYKTDGTTLTQIEELVGGDDSFITHVGTFNGKFYFTAYSDALTDFGSPKKDLFITDGNVMKVMYADNAIHPSYNIPGFIDDAGSIGVSQINDQLFFFGTNISGDQTVFAYDQNTTLREFVTTPYSTQFDTSTLAYWNGKYYIRGSDGVNGTNLYESTDVGLNRIYSTLSNGGVYSLNELNHQLYFAADDSTGHGKLFKYDGTYISKITDFDPTMTDFDSGGNCNLSEFHYFANAIWTDMLVDSNTCLTKLTRICATNSTGDCVH